MSTSHYSVEIDILEVPGYPGYGVSAYGATAMLWTRWQQGRWGKLLDTWRPMCPFIQNGGYILAKVRRDGDVVPALLHRLVAMAYNGPCPDGEECRHLDDCKWNNNPDNLAWGTRLDNTDDRERNGKTLRGTSVGNSKLEEADVIEIRRLCGEGLNYEVIGPMFGVSPANISMIHRGKTWKHLLPPNSPAA